MTTTNADQDHGSTYTTHLFGGLSGRVRVASGKQLPDAPLLIAIHGGTYTSAYFDLPGYSLLARAAALGVPALALDRPGYGESPSLPLDHSSIQDQADALIVALEDAWRQYGATTRGIVLVGHSIGGAIAISIAACSKTLPLIGLAVSGVGLRVPPHFPDQWRALPEGPTVEFPVHLKDIGPPERHGHVRSRGKLRRLHAGCFPCSRFTCTTPGDHRYCYHMAGRRAGCGSSDTNPGTLPTGRG
jgi:pimeloyl-ACP methyl ester carboxylesterase